MLFCLDFNYNIKTMNARQIFGCMFLGLACLAIGAWTSPWVSCATERSFVLTSSSPGVHHDASPNWPSPVGRAVVADESAFVRAASASVDAVVHVQTASVVADQSNPWLSMLGMTPGRIAQGSGSGVIIEEDGLIVTNHHVIQGAREVWVNTSNGASFKARVVGSDPSTDLALLEIDADRPLQALAFGNSDDIRVGEWVLAVGNPLNLTSTVTAGIISAKGRNIRLLESNVSKDIYPVESFLQTDAAVNPGNSGGALVNMDGELIGINTAIASQTGSYAGYSFAIPSAIVAKVARDLKEFGRVQRAYLGIQVAPRKGTIEVTTTLPDGGAHRAGILAGDVITAVNDIQVKSFPSLQEQLSKRRPGERVNLTVQRNERFIEFPVTLTDRSGTTELNVSRVRDDSISKEANGQELTSDRLFKIWGIRLAEVPENVQRSLHIRGGLMVSEIQPGAWTKQGLKEGFILLRVDGTPIRNEKDLLLAATRAMEEGQDGLLIEGMYRNGQRAYAGVAVP